MFFSVKSFLELVDYIFTIPGIKFFLSERLSQDPLENFFGCQRQRGKSHENPNVAQFCKNTQALRVINGTCGSVSKGNCRGKKEGIDWQKENQPLPKRKRVRLNKTPSSKLDTSNTPPDNDPKWSQPTGSGDPDRTNGCNPSTLLFSDKKSTKLESLGSLLLCDVGTKSKDPDKVSTIFYTML